MINYILFSMLRQFLKRGHSEACFAITSKPREANSSTKLIVENLFLHIDQKSYKETVLFNVNYKSQTVALYLQLKLQNFYRLQSWTA